MTTTAIRDYASVTISVTTERRGIPSDTTSRKRIIARGDEPRAIGVDKPNPYHARMAEGSPERIVRAPFWPNFVRDPMDVSDRHDA